MNVRNFILKETGILAIGQLICVSIMVGLFALLGKFHWSVVLGGAVGTVLSLGNFFFMAISADLAADKARNQDVKGGQAAIKSSFLLRLLVIFAILFVFAKSGLVNILAMVLPLAFVRPILTVTEFFRKSGDRS